MVKSENEVPEGGEAKGILLAVSLPSEVLPRYRKAVEDAYEDMELIVKHAEKQATSGITDEDIVRKIKRNLKRAFESWVKKYSDSY